MPTITIRWDATLDMKTCPVCQSLHGYQWVFPITQDQGLPQHLVHPSYGTVWSTYGGSRAHGHDVFNCRCVITPDVDMSDLVAQIEQMSALVNESVTYVEFIRYGRTVGAFRDTTTGRFVSGP